MKNLKIKWFIIIIATVLINTIAIKCVYSNEIDIINQKDMADMLLGEGNYIEAEKIYLELLKNSEKINNDVLAEILYNLGRTYENLNDTNNAIKYYYDSLELNKKIMDYDAANIIYFRLGLLLDKKGEIDNAIICFKNSYTVSKAVRENLIRAHSSFKLGVLYLIKENNGASIRYFMEAYKYHMNQGNLKNAGITAYYIGEIYHKEGEVEKCIDIWEMSINLLKRSNSDEWKIIENEINSILLD